MKEIVNKFGRGKVLAVFGVVFALVALVVGVGMMNQETEAHEETTLKQDTLTLEVYSELSMELSDYLDHVDTKKTYAMDFTRVEMDTVGSYEASITYDKQEFIIQIEVVDTTAPTLSVDKTLVFALTNTSLSQLQQLLIDAVVIEDNYDKELTLDKTSLAQLALQSSAKAIVYEMRATDSSGNVGTCKVVVQFTEDGKKDDSLPQVDYVPGEREEEEPEAIKPTSITLSHLSVNLEVGKTVKVTGSIQPSDATNKEVNYTSEDASIASVSSDGTITAKAVGTTRIAVSAKEDSKVVSYVSVTVTKAATSETPKPEETKPTSITLSATTLSMDIGATQKVNASVAPSAATNKNVTFASENNNVVSVDANGTITAKAAGTTRVVVTASGNTSVKAYVSVTVKAAATTPTPPPAEVKPTGVTLNPTTLSLEVGKASKVTATIAPSDATNKNVTFASENNGIATVDANGNITAKAAGTTKIVVTATGNSAAKAYVTVTVTAPTVVVPPTLERDPLDHSLWTIEEMMEALKFRNTYTGEYYNIHNVRWGIHVSDTNRVGGLKVVENPHDLLFSETLTGRAGFYHDIGTVITVVSRGVDKNGISAKQMTIGAHNPAHSFDMLTIAADELLKYQ
ncbi:MAG: Ig-like domain-containing protein [Erysipelotrichaceae bacterium]